MSDTEITTPGKRPQGRQRVPATTQGPLSPLAIFQQIIQNALATGASTEVLREILAWQKSEREDEARRAYDAAIAAAKADLPTITKNRQVGFDSKKPGASRTSYKHEDLATIASAIDEPLSKHGISYRFRTHNPPGQPITVTCIVSHREGHSEENSLSGPADDSGNKNKHQAIGSAVTYLSRYTLKAALGLSAAHDDDAQATSADTAAINAEQLDKLQSLIAHVGQDIEKFCRYFAIEKVADLRARDYDEAIYQLEQKKLNQPERKSS
jgi:hypothetical protein